jgi:hypothetical protein
MQVSGLGAHSKEWVSLVEYRLLDALPLARLKIRQNYSLPPGNSVPLIVMESGNRFPVISEE